MSHDDDASLLPPVETLYARLAENLRERRMLRTLLRLALRERKFREESNGNPTRTDIQRK
jgi:exoribonuclease R